MGPYYAGPMKYYWKYSGGLWNIMRFKMTYHRERLYERFLIYRFAFFAPFWLCLIQLAYLPRKSFNNSCLEALSLENLVFFLKSVDATVKKFVCSWRFSTPFHVIIRSDRNWPMARHVPKRMTVGQRARYMKRGGQSKGWF